MKVYELMTFLAKQRADAEVEIWGPDFSEAAKWPDDSVAEILEAPAGQGRVLITFGSYTLNEELKSEEGK